MLPGIIPVFNLGAGPLATPVNLGAVTGSSGAATSVVITTAVDVPAGSLIVVIAQCMKAASSTGPSGCSDGVNGAYTKIDADQVAAGPNGASNIWYFANSGTLASGSSITITFASGQTTYGAAAMACAAQATPLDDHNHQTSGTSSGAHSVTGSTLAQASEIVIGMEWGQNTGDITNDGAFTALTGYDSGAISAGKDSEAVWGYKIVAATTAVSYAPSSSTGGNGWWENIISFKQ